METERGFNGEEQGAQIMPEVQRQVPTKKINCQDGVESQKSVCLEDATDLASNTQNDKGKLRACLVGQNSLVTT